MRTIILLTLASCSILSCKPAIVTTPQANDVILQVTQGAVVQNYCDVIVQNLWDTKCHIELTGTLNYLKLKSALPSELAPKQSVTLHFEIIGFDPGIICASPPCYIDEVKIRGSKWEGYGVEDYYFDASSKIKWKAPTEVFANCWAHDYPVGEGSGNYYTPSCRTPPPGVLGEGPKYDWKQYKRIYNPNDFDLEVLVGATDRQAGECVPDRYRANDKGVWKPFPKFTWFEYYDVVQANGPLPMYCETSNEPDIHLYCASCNGVALIPFWVDPTP